MGLPVFLIIAGAVLLAGVYWMLRQQRRASLSLQRPTSPIPVNLASASDAVVLASEHGRVLFANDHARAWFALDGGDPNLETMAEMVRPPDVFRELFAAEGRASFQVGYRRVEGASHLLPGEHQRRLVVVMRELTADRAAYSQSAVRALVILGEVGRILGENRPLAETLNAILACLDHNIDSEAGEICLWEPDPGILRPMARCGAPSYLRAMDQDHDGVYQPGESYGGWVVAYRQSLLIEDVDARQDIRPPKHVASLATFRSYVGAPLVVGERLIGTLELVKAEANGFDHEDLALLEAVASQTALAVDWARIAREQDEREGELTGLRQIAEAADSLADRCALFQRLTNDIARLMDVTMCGLLLYDADRARLSGQPPFYGIPDPVIEAYQFDLSPGTAARRIWDQEEGWYSNQAREEALLDELALPDLAEMAGIHTLAQVPMTVGAARIGAVQVSDRRDGEDFTPGDLHRLRAFAAQAAIVIQAARLGDRTRQQAGQFDALREIGQIIEQDARADDVCAEALGRLAALLRVEVCGILLRDPDGDSLRPCSPFIGVDESLRHHLEMPSAEGNALMRHLEAHGHWFSNDLGRDALAMEAGLDQWTSWLGVTQALIVPLVIGRRWLGVLQVGNRQNGALFSEDDARLLSVFGAQLALALDNDQWQARLSRQRDVAQALQHLAAITTSAAALDDLIREALAETAAMFASDIAFIDLLDEQSGKLRLAPAHIIGSSLTEALVADAYARDFEQSVFNARRPFLSNDLPNDRRVLELYRGAVDQLGLRNAILVPLAIDEQSIGELGVANRREGGYEESEVALLASVAASLSAAIERARLVEATDQTLQARLTEMDALSRVSNELNITVELERIMDVARHEALRVTGATGCTILLLSPRQEWEEFDLPEQMQRYGAQQVLPETAPIERQVIWGEQAIAIDQYDDHELEASPADAVSALAVPILYGEGERVVGVIHLYDGAPAAFDDRDAAFVNALAIKVATAYGNATSFHEQVLRNRSLSQRVEQLNQIFELGQVLRTETSIEYVLEAVAHAVQMSVGFSVVLISLLDEQRETFLRVAQAGIPLAEFEALQKVTLPREQIEALFLEPFRISESYLLLAERVSEWRTADFAAKYFHYADDYNYQEGRADAWHPDDALLVPLRDSHGHVIGIMTLDSPVKGQRPGRAMIETLEIFAHQAAISVENFRLVEAMQAEAAAARYERDRMERLYLVSSEIQEAADVPSRLQVIVNAVRDAGWARVHITLRDEALEPTTLLSTGYNDKEVDALRGSLLSGETWQRRMADPAFHDMRLGSAYYLPYDAPWVVEHLWGVEFDGEGAASRLHDRAWHPLDQLYLPIYGTDSRMIGLMGMSDPADGLAPTEASLRPIELFARQAASVIEMTRLYLETRQAAEQEGLLNELMQAVTTTLDTATVVRAVASGLQHLMPFTQMSVGLHNEEADGFDMLEVRFLHATEVEVTPGAPWPTAGTAMGETHRRGRAGLYRAEDAETTPPYADLLTWQDQRERTTLLVPMVAGGRAVGVLRLGSDLSQAFGFDENLPLVQRIANLAAVSIQNARLYQQAVDRERFSAAMARLNRELNATLQLGKALENICNESLDILDVEGAYIWQAEEDALVGIAGAGPGREAFLNMRIARDDARILAVRVANEQRPLYANDLDEQSDVVVALADYLPARAIMGVPLVREGRVLGVLALIETNPDSPFTDADVEQASIFATHAAIALESARLYQETHDLQRFTSAIVESIQQGIVVLDREQRVVTLNEFMRLRFGWDDSAVAQPIFAYRPHYEDVLAPGLESVLQTGEPWVSFGVPETFPEGWQITQNFYLYPLKEGDEVTGVVWLLEDVTEQAMLEADLETRASQLAVLTEVSSHLTATLESGEVVTLVLDQLARVLPYDSVTLWLREGDDLRIAAARGYGGEAEELVGLRVALEDSALFRDMAEHKQVLNVHDVRRDERFPGAAARPTRSWLGAPLISKGEIIGLLALEKVEPAYYQVTHEQLALAFANQAAVALDNARLFEQAHAQTAGLAQQAERLALVNRVSVMLAHTLDTENIFEVALQESAQALGVTTGRALMFETDPRVARVVVEYPRGDAPPSDIFNLDDNPAVEHVRQTLQPLVVPDAQHDDILYHMHEDLIRRDVTSLVMAPLSVGGQVLGALVLEAIGQPRRFAQDQLELAQTIANQAAIAIQNAHLFEQSVIRTRELETLFAASHATSLTLDLQTAVQSVGQQMINALEADECAVMFWDDVESTLELRSVVDRWGDVEEAVPVGTTLPLSDYPARLQVLTGRETLIINPEDERADAKERAEMVETGSVARLLVPLVTRDQASGLIKIDLRTPFRNFALTDLRIAQTLAGQAAIAIENARLNTETAAKVEELMIINDLSRAMSAVVDMQELLPIVRAQVPSLTQSEWFLVVLYNQDADVLSFPVAVHEGQDIAMAERPLGTDEFSYVLRSGRPLFLVGQELGALRRNLKIDPALPAARAFLGVPLTVGDETVGVLAVADEHNPRAFSVNDQRILSTVAGQLAVTVQNARLVGNLEQLVRSRTGELRQERDRLNRLYNITAELSATLDIDRVLERALDLLAEAVGADQGVIMLIDHQRDILSIRAELGFAPGERIDDEDRGFRMTEGLSGWVIQHHQSVVIDDLQQDPRWLQITPADRIPRAALAVLLETGDDVQGVMMLYSREPGVFDETHLRLVTAAANQLGTAINNAELYLFIREQAERLGDMVREQQIETSKSNSILESVADGVMFADQNGNIILFNDAARRILELDGDAIIGRPISSLSGLYGGGSRRWAEAIEDWMSDPAQIETGEYISEVLDLGDKIINVSLSPVNMGDQFLGTVSVFRDVTRDVEVDRMKSEFISNVSHELRTPMTSIKGYADLLVMGAAGEVSDRQQEFLATIKTNADRLSTLVNDLLDISRIDAGRLELKFQPVSLGDLVEMVVANLRGRIENEGKAITVDSEIPAGLPFTYADPNKLTQIMTNLVDNAFQYTLEGGKITVSVRQEDTNRFLLSVSDTGIGIPEENRARVFERFFRSDDQALVMETPGTGLGLAIVRELVEMHGGRIWYESAVGEGTTFHVSLPWLQEPPAEAASLRGLRG